MLMSGTMLTRALAALKVSSVLQHAGFGAGACSDRPLVINHGEPGRWLSLLSFNKYKCSQEGKLFLECTNTQNNLLQVTFCYPKIETRINNSIHKIISKAFTAFTFGGFG